MTGRRPPRIEGFSYLGPYSYFLTACTFRRVPWFARDDCANTVIADLLRTSDDYGFAVLAYCLMPDHAHCLVEGLRPDSNWLKCAAMFKQRSAFSHARQYGEPLWQEGYFERVLRDEDDRIGIAAYIVNNPIRAGLCSTVIEYPYIGSSRYSIDQLVQSVQISPRP